MKLKPALPENIFMMTENSLPKESDTDPNGNIMVYKRDRGWYVIDLKSTYTFYDDLKYTHWTFTPEVPDV
tara:strand:+ start:758 stop:967 length:210 start_codon:yes stop_codon:yes gene_type:complete